jgi:hypothetical protein
MYVTFLLGLIKYLGIILVDQIKGTIMYHSYHTWISIQPVGLYLHI